jgi:hypothetical protein
VFGVFKGLSIMKAKQTLADLSAVSVTSFKDAGYQSAVNSERSINIARFVVEQCPNFLDDIPKEIKAELDAGFALRWQEINPAKTYNAEWIPDTNGKNLVTLDFCMSYSQQAFGQMRNENPALHKIIGDIRTKFNKYRHNKTAELKTAVRKLLNEGKTSTREQAKAFDEWVNGALDSIKARAKTAEARSDATANEVKARQAIEAFKKVYFS